MLVGCQRLPADAVTSDPILLARRVERWKVTEQREHGGRFKTRRFYLGAPLLHLFPSPRSHGGQDRASRNRRSDALSAGEGARDFSHCERRRSPTIGVAVAYAHRPTIYDADSHLMEGLDWLRDRADSATRELLPDLTAVLDRGGAGAGSAIQKGEARIADPVRTAVLAQDVIASAKGWLALGAMDGGERSQALDLLGFTSQLVFSTFSLGLFALSDDLDLVYGGAASHNRMMSDFCAHDPRLVGVGFLPLNDPERSLKSLAEALELGCGALWVTHATSSGRSPSHVDNDPVWAAVQEAGVPIVMHIGGG